jgi:hypothetical protein
MLYGCVAVAVAGGVVDVGVRVVVVGVLEMGQRHEWGHSAHDALRAYRHAYR